MASAIIDPDRLVIGTEDGLYCIDLDQLGVFCEYKLILLYNFQYTILHNLC